MPDYYTILGLDPAASPQSVKVAYRRLARQHHPDLQAAGHSQAQKASADAHMAQLNEAYAVLSDSKSRREYDDRMRLEVVLASKTATTSAGERQTDQTQTSSSRVHHARIRPRHEVDSTVITQFSGHVRETFTNKKSGFSWNEMAHDGFDWGLEALTWSTAHCVALRGVAVIDPARAKQVVNYAEMVITRCKRPIRKNYFLFLLPFLQMSEWDSVSSQLQLLLSGKSSGVTPPPTGVILLDMHHGRTLRLGCRFVDKRFEEFIQSIKASG